MSGEIKWVNLFEGNGGPSIPFLGGASAGAGVFLSDPSACNPENGFYMHTSFNFFGHHIAVGVGSGQ